VLRGELFQDVNLDRKLDATVNVTGVKSSGLIGGPDIMYYTRRKWVLLHKFCAGKFEERKRHLRHFCINARIILRLILRKNVFSRIWI